MSLPWFRMYTEFARDHVVQSLAFEDQRHFVMALCMKGEGVLDKAFGSSEARTSVICKALGLDPVAAAEANRRLRERGLVDENWQPVNWEKRQSRHDLSTERTRRFKNKNKKPKDGERDIDIERNSSGNSSQAFPDVRQAYPQGLYPEADWLIAEKYASTLADTVGWAPLIDAAAQYRAQCIARGSVPNFVKSPANFYSSQAWRGPFPLPVSKAQTRQDKNVDVAQRWLDANQ